MIGASSRFSVALRLACGMSLGLLAAGVASAQTTMPPAAAQFQQTVRQQQVSDQLQKSQSMAQQSQNVSNVSQQPLAQDSAARHQQEQAEQAQRDRDNARQQDLANQYRDAVSAPPPQSTDSPPKKHGH